MSAETAAWARLHAIVVPRPTASRGEWTAYHESYLSAMREVWDVLGTEQWVRDRITRRVESSLAGLRGSSHSLTAGGGESE